MRCFFMTLGGSLIIILLYLHSRMPHSIFSNHETQCGPFSSIETPESYYREKIINSWFVMEEIYKLFQNHFFMWIAIISLIYLFMG